MTLLLGMIALGASLLVGSPALASGAVLCWGSDDDGQATPPPSVDGTTGTATAIAAWEDYSCAIQADTYAVVCWGGGYWGPPTLPPSVDGSEGTATAIAVGGYLDHGAHPCFCAIQAGTDAVVCWGDDDWGQATPPPSVDGTIGTATAIATNGHSSCAIQAGTGAVICWGGYLGSVLPPPPSVDGSEGTATAIAVGGSYGERACAIRAETGAVVCWGATHPPPPSVDGTDGTATAVAMSSWDHSCAIQAETGAVVCWDNRFGDDPPTPPPSVDGTTGTATAIAAGAAHSCAIQAETGAVICWDRYGLTPTPPPSVDGSEGMATAIAAGGDHNCAIRAPLCSDGLDNDGDGMIDFDPVTFANPGDQYTPPSGSGDPACFDPAVDMENPLCQDGINNDAGQDDLIDYDGGQSIWGDCTGVPGGCPANVSDPEDDGVANPDPQCVGTPWKNREARPSSCGLGTELALLLPPLMWLYRRRSLH